MCIIDRLPENLTTEQKREAVELIRHYADRDLWSKHQFDIGQVDPSVYDFKMQLKPGCKPVRESLRPHPEQYERAIEQYCYQAEAAGLIERSHAPHMSNLVVVRKRNFQFDPNNPLSGLRIVCDYRKLNISTEPSFVG